MDNELVKLFHYLAQCEKKHGIFTPVLTPEEMEILLAHLSQMVPVKNPMADQMSYMDLLDEAGISVDQKAYE